jgi:hypothetical protein
VLTNWLATWVYLMGADRSVISRGR